MILDDIRISLERWVQSRAKGWGSRKKSPGSGKGRPRDGESAPGDMSTHQSDSREREKGWGGWGIGGSPHSQNVPQTIGVQVQLTFNNDIVTLSVAYHATKHDFTSLLLTYLPFFQLPVFNFACAIQCQMLYSNPTVFYKSTYKTCSV